MRFTTYSILTLAILLSSCRKGDDIISPAPPNNPNGMLKKVWVRPLVESPPPGGLCISGFMYEGKVYYNNEYKAELKGYPLDGQDKVESLGTGNFIPMLSKRSTIKMGSDLYYMSMTWNIQKIDLNSGHITDLYQGNNRMGTRISYYDGKIYFDQGYIERSVLLSLDVQTQELDTLIDYSLEPGWQGSFEPPLPLQWAGRNYLAFQLREAGPQASGKQSYFLHDVEADSLAWSIVGLDTLAGGVGEPAYDDQHIYWMGGTSVFALNLEDGEMAWRHDNPDQKGHYHGFTFMHNGKLIVKSDGMLTTALEPTTGNVVWMNQKSGSTPSDTYGILDNALCFYSRGKGYFSAVDLSTGESLIYEISPVKNYDNSATMGTSIVIDQATRRLYYANHSDVVCLEIAPF